MSTVILPPGMTSVSAAGNTDKEDIDSTLVLPPDQAPSADSGELGAGTIPPDGFQDTLVSEPTSFEEDAERTMILAPQQVEEITSAVKAEEIQNGGGDNQAQTEDFQDDDDEATMILSSDPTRRNTSPPKNPMDAGLQKQSVSSAKEENIEKTLPLTSDPVSAIGLQASPTEETDIEQTVALNSDEADAIKLQEPEPPSKPDQNAAQNKQQKIDQSIEDDETLVMHSNTYKPIKHDKK